MYNIQRCYRMHREHRNVAHSEFQMLQFAWYCYKEYLFRGRESVGKWDHSVQRAQNARQQGNPGWARQHQCRHLLVPFQLFYWRGISTPVTLPRFVKPPSRCQLWLKGCVIIVGLQARDMHYAGFESSHDCGNTSPVEQLKWHQTKEDDDDILNNAVT